ncbi:MAG: ATP-binding protein [Cyanobacteria bacterium J06643_13]
MLIEFSVANYLSFKEKVTFSMAATDFGDQTELDENTLDKNNIFAVDEELSLLKSAAVYGANASGKSNLIKAFGFMRWFVLNSSSHTQITDEINVSRFRLSTETINQPSFFEIVFILNKKIYRYGFELNKKQILSEWLYYTSNVQENRYFEREKQNITVLTRFYEGKFLESKTRPNALFLSVAAQFNGKVSEQILLWFKTVGVLSGINSNIDDLHTLRLMQNNEYKEDILALIRKLDLGINDIVIHKTSISLEDFPTAILEKMAQKDGKTITDIETLSGVDIKTVHCRYDSDGNFIANEEFDLDRDESEGTKKLFAFAAPILQTLKEGRILFVDELDARLHPLITKTIVELFNSTETNPNNAQLIFTIHDTNLLTKDLFRKDQIWFTEKDRYEATDLYSLVEYELTSDAMYEGDYIEGRYGAIPFIGDFKSVIS